MFLLFFKVKLLEFYLKLHVATLQNDDNDKFKFCLVLVEEVGWVFG